MSLSNSIVWFASYPRSGNTWLRFLVSSAFFGTNRDWTGQNRAVDAIHQRLAAARGLGLGPEAALGRIRIEQEKSPRGPELPRELLIKTHFRLHENHPFLARTRGAVLLIRHARDVLLSAINYHLLTGRLREEEARAHALDFARTGGDAFWRAEGYGDWASHAESWMRAAFPVLVVRFEALRANPTGELRRVLAFLGADVAEDRIEAAVADCSKKRLAALEMRSRHVGEFPVADESRSFVGRCDSLSRLEDLGEDVARAFDERFGPDLERLGYGGGSGPGAAK